MKNKKSLTIIFITVFIDLMGFGILMPILPTFASKELAISDFEIGIIVAIFSFAQFIFNPILGKYSDKIGRRPIILVTLLFTSVSYLIFSFATSFLILLVSRLIAGIGGSNIGVAQAYIADVTSKKERSKGMGLIGAAFGLGFVFGPLLGGILATYGYSVAGYFAAGFSFISFIFAYFWLPESKKLGQVTREKEFKLIDLKFFAKVIRNPIVGLLMGIYFIIVFSMANIYGTFSLLGFKIYSFTDKEIGYLFGIIGIVSAIIQGVAINKLGHKFAEKSLIITGIIAMIIGLGMLPYGQNFLGVAIVVSILSIGSGLLQPVLNSMVSKYSPEEAQGEILGLNQSLASFARVLGPLWGGIAFDFIGYQFPFLTGAIFTFFTLIIVIFMLNSQKLKEAQS